jgi:thioredoxin 1
LTDIKGGVRMSINRIKTCFILVSLLLIFIQNSVATNASRNSSDIFEVNDSTLNSSIDTNPLFILDCYAPWCEPCILLNATIHKLAHDLDGQIAVGQIDMDYNKRTEELYNITGYPTILIFEKRKLADRQLGNLSEAELIDALSRVEPNLNASNIILTIERHETYPNRDRI